MVPMNTSTIANASSTAVSFSDVKNSTIFFMVGVVKRIGWEMKLFCRRIFCGLNKLDERVFLLRDEVGITHQFVKPSLTVARQHHADEPRRFAGARVSAGHVNERRLAISHLKHRLLLLRVIYRRRQPNLLAPAVDVRHESSAVAGELAHADCCRCVASALDVELGENKLRDFAFFPVRRNGPSW